MPLESISKSIYKVTLDYCLSSHLFLSEKQS